MFQVAIEKGIGEILGAKRMPESGLAEINYKAARNARLEALSTAKAGPFPIERQSILRPVLWLLFLVDVMLRVVDLENPVCRRSTPVLDVEDHHRRVLALRVSDRPLAQLVDLRNRTSW
jgi:hypothetical protein